MRERPSSRLLVIDRSGRMLLFRFEHKKGPLAGQTFWATPGGGIDPGESFAQAAYRELLEETGISTDDLGPVVHRRVVTFQMPDGEMVRGEECFFLIQMRAAEELSTERWTELEREVMADHRWWSADELRCTAEQVWPENLNEVLVRAGVWAAYPS